LHQGALIGSLCAQGVHCGAKLLLWVFCIAGLVKVGALFQTFEDIWVCGARLVIQALLEFWSQGMIEYEVFHYAHDDTVDSQ